MKLTIQPTEVITTVDGTRVRLWEGEDESGVPVFCAVMRVAVQTAGARGATNEQMERFERELQEVPPPRELPLAEAYQQMFRGPIDVRRVT